MADRVEILFVRLGAFGDVLHALPCAASLKRGIAGARLTWVIDPRWRWLLAGNPDVDDVVELDRKSLESVKAAYRILRQRHFDIGVDAQGLIKSSLVVRMSGAPRRIGYAAEFLRERAAGLFYTHPVSPVGAHVVEQGLALAAAAGSERLEIEFPLPAGEPGGTLPPGPFVLAAPFAGWKAKQWPMEHWSELGRLIRSETGLGLVLNNGKSFDAPAHCDSHVSSLPGLLDATRAAVAVVGLDSGPLHLAAALEKQGVALFGPTDPARNGPYGDTIAVLRHHRAPTTYRRIDEILPCMESLTPRTVFDRLHPCLTLASRNATQTR